MGANEDDSTPGPGGEISPADRALRRLLRDLLAAFHAYRLAPEDDHGKGRFARLEAVMAQHIAVVTFIETVSELAPPDGMEDIQLHLLPDPLRAMLDQLNVLKEGLVGSLLEPVERGQGRPPLPLSVRRRRALRVAAWQIFEMGGLLSEEAAQRVVAIGTVSDLTERAEGEGAEGGRAVEIRKDVPSVAVLRQWAKELRERPDHAPEVVIYRRYIDEAERRFQSGEFDHAALLRYAEAVLRMPWP